MAIDHVIYAVHDLERTAARLKRDLGLTFSAGGRHPGGTRNAIARLKPTQYLELLAPEDPSGGDGARGLIERMAGQEQLVGWAIEVEDIEAVGRRVSRDVVPGSITLEDGSVRSWRVVYRKDKGFPFFIEYDGGRAPRLARWSSEAFGNERFGGFTWIEIAAPESEMRGWLGDLSVSIKYVAGEPGIRAVGIEGPDGEVVIR